MDNMQNKKTNNVNSILKECGYSILKKYDDMLENTPGFAEFVEEHKNDSLEDLIIKYDLPKELLDK